MGRRSQKIAVPLNKLEEELVVQLSFLRKSIKEFDDGDLSEFRRLATTLRLLLHQTRNSHSLVSQVGLENSPFTSYATPLNPDNLLTEFSLAMMSVSNTHTVYLPILDQGPYQPRNLSLENWKTEAVLRDDRRIEFTRWELVQIVANQAGGAHVDPEIEEKYHRLVNENSIGWMKSNLDGSSPVLDLEKVYIRHISWEALVSIETSWAKILGNRICQCGSGRKARYCCQKQAKASA